MPRRKRQDESNDVNDALIEARRQNIRTLARQMGIQPMELVAWMGALLIGAPIHSLSGGGLQAATTRMDPELAAVEVDGEARTSARNGSGKSNATRKASKNKVTGIQKYWAQFTPKQRAKMMHERQAKWSAAAKKKWGHGKHTGHGKRDAAKQRLYTQRSRAKATGQMPPPLPGEKAAA